MVINIYARRLLIKPLSCSSIHSPLGGRFHMQNVKAPLDIGFFDGAGKLIRTMVMDTYDDGNKRRYHPGQRFQYALEARVGFFNEHKLSANKARLVVHSVND